MVHTHTQTSAETTKKKHAPGSTSAMLCGSGGQLNRQQAPVIKATAKAKKATKTSRKKRQRTSTCAAVIHHPGWPRVTWYGMPSYFVPLSQSWGVTTGTFFIEIKARANTHQKKKRGRSSSKASHKNSLPSWPWKNSAQHKFVTLWQEACVRRSVRDVARRNIGGFQF